MATSLQLRPPGPALLTFLAGGLATLPSSAEFVEPRDPLPVIQKVQWVFSMVSHPIHQPDRQSFYNEQGDPAGYEHYAVPYLVCDPLVTLFNPHPTSDSLQAFHLLFQEPPVGFRFRKNGRLLRPEAGEESFAGLAAFQQHDPGEPPGRKTFTLSFHELFSRDSPSLSRAFNLQPGEMRIHAPFVASRWDWSFEVPGTGEAYRFYDWDPAADLTNADRRRRSGVVMVPSIDPRAGFQWDSLAAANRLPETLYDFEQGTSWTDGRVALRLEDEITVEARVRSSSDPSESHAGSPDFGWSLLASLNPDDEPELFQDVGFQASSVNQPESLSAAEPSVQRTFRIGELMQDSEDNTPGGKQPFAILTMVARTESLLSGELARPGALDGDAHYHLRFDPAAGYHTIFRAGGEELHIAPTREPEVTGVSVVSDHEFRMTVASPDGIDGWTLRGGPNLAELETELSPLSPPVQLPSTAGGSRLDMISIDRSNLGEQHFFRLESPEP